MTAAAAGALPALAGADSVADDRAERALEQVAGHMSAGRGPATSGSVGARWTAVLKERFESTLYYRVCVRLRAKPKVRSCRKAETNDRGLGRVSFSGFVARHGPGRYVAEWTGGGLDHGRWRFRVR